MLCPRLPSSTYRIQLNKDFRFAETCEVLDYLHELGVSDVYLSPILASRKGSSHGYDVTDPTRINPDLGSEEDFATLQAELQKRDMGLLLDIVPNHMAASAENPWWMDVLENGAHSAFAAYFDIEWHPHARALDGRILLPALGRPFGEALDSGEIKLVFQEGRFFFQYFDSLFPVAPRSYHAILNYRFDRPKETPGEDATAYHEYSGILASVRQLSRADRRSSENVADNRLRFESASDRLRSLVNQSKEITEIVEQNVAAINGEVGNPATFSFLQQLLTEQNYKLSFWQNLNESINYRRFFTIADLVGVRVEDPVVFEATHGYILRLVSKTACAGLRVDHIDGLRDPLAYLGKLQERLTSGDGRSEAAPSYVLVEKIISPGEVLPGDWRVCGTTGYEYLNQANGLFVVPKGAPMEEIYSSFIGRRQTFPEVVYRKKKMVMSSLLGVEMRTLGRQLADLAAQDRYGRELQREHLIEALIEVTAFFPFYRTYIRNMDVPASAAEHIDEAIKKARSHAAHLDSASFDFVREVLLLQNLPHVLADQREARLSFVMRWQQFTGPIVAKGLEDTALYVYYPLLSLNEVGGNPDPSEAATREEFFSFLEERGKNWSGSLNASETHDTKRGEDVRARINVLSEIPQEWKQHLERWAEQNAKHKVELEGQPVPDRNEEYFLYQTLIGVWPNGDEDRKSVTERVQAHLVKATREAMIHTRWTRPNQRHEEALQKFVADILSPRKGEEHFLSDFRNFQKRVAYFGMINSLSQTLLKIAAPGVADFYQGSELWDLRLVDPDNRGPIDFAVRKSALADLADTERADCPCRLKNLLENWHDGRIKMYLIWKALRFRREQQQLFREGEFIPLQTTGLRAPNMIAFLRKLGTEYALIAVPRWLSQMAAVDQNLQCHGLHDAAQDEALRNQGVAGGREAGNGAPASFDWTDTAIMLPKEIPSRWNSILTPKKLAAETNPDGAFVMANDLFQNFPVGLFRAQ